MTRQEYAAAAAERVATRLMIQGAELELYQLSRLSADERDLLVHREQDAHTISTGLYL